MKTCFYCERPYSRMRIQNPGMKDERYVCQKCLKPGERSGNKAGEEGESCVMEGSPHLHGYFVAPGYVPVPAIGIPTQPILSSQSTTKEYIN